MYGVYNYISDTISVSGIHNLAAILWLHLWYM